MLTFKGKLKEVVRTYQDELIFTIKTDVSNLPDDEITSLTEAKNGLKVELSKWREKRTLNANNYAWVLMDKIAQATKTTKEDIYKQIILKVGVFEILPIKDIAVKSFISRWQSKGLGWVCVVKGLSKLNGYTNVMAYYGTSTYNTEEMARFIDEIVYEAKELGIQTETPDQIAEMLNLWEQQGNV